MGNGKSRQILNDLLSEIRRGTYDNGRSFPSEADLVARFGAARETVRKAIGELGRMGLVCRKKGVGTFVVKRAMKRSGLIGLLTPDASSAQLFGDLLAQLSRLASANGFGVVVQQVPSGTVGETEVLVRRIAREMAVKGVEGVIFRPLVDERLSKANREVLRIFRNAETPVVLIDSDACNPPERSACDLVAVDNVAAGRRVAEHLHERGRKRIAFMTLGNHLQNNANWRNRLFGVAGELALRNVKAAVRSLTFLPDNKRQLRHLFKTENSPDAIVCGNDETAAALVMTLKSIGKRIPEDVAVVGFDDTAVAASCEVPLTTVRQPTTLIAKTAFRTLLMRIARPGEDPREIRLDAPLIVRAST